ncbi:MAG: hypothetical protein IJA85_02315 [Clostridia bacterium]|nr:hypothetical protein [Clostridia bacterium]
MKKKLTALLLASLMLLTAACSADAGEETPETTVTAAPVTEAEDSETQVTTDIPEGTDLAGYEFRIMTGNWMDVKSDYYDFESLNGDVVNDAVYNRNRKVEQALNCTISQTLSLSDIIGGSDIKRLVKSGDDVLDAAVNLDRFAMQLALDNYLISFTDLPGVDLTKPYWYQNVNDQLTFYGQLYTAASYYDLTCVDAMFMLIFNKDHFTNYKLEDPYELVRQGKWTMDVMYKMITDVTGDLDGDGEMTDSDLWGAVFNGDQWLRTFLVSNEALAVEVDNEGNPYFSAYGNERFFAIADKLANYFTSPDLYFGMGTHKSRFDSTYAADPYERAIQLFAAGNALFHPAQPSYTVQLRGMELDYGIIPIPKFEEVEPGTPYSSRLGGFLPLVIPACNRHPEETGYILEALSCESYLSVVPQYYEIMLKQKQTRDEDSIEMIEMMDANRVCNLAENYWLETFSFIENSLKDGENKLASEMEKNLKTVNKTLEKFIEKMSEK